jgi:hypothetical protein
MANVKISALPAATSVAAADTLPIVQSATTKKATFGDVAGAVGGIRVYASTAARDSAITSPTAGMVVYINSNDASEGMYHYTGGAWYKGATWNEPWGFNSAASLTTNLGSNGAISLGGLVTTETIVQTTVSTTVGPNRALLIHGTLRVNLGSAQTVEARIRKGTTTAGTVIGISINAWANSGSKTINFTAIDTSPSATQQYCLTALVSGGAHDFYNPIGLTVSDIGPSGAPA